MQLSEHSKELFDQEDVLLQYEAHVSSTSIDPNDAITPVMSAAVVLQTLDEDTIVQDVKGDNFTEEQVTPLDTTKDLVDCSDDDQAVDVLQDSTSEHSEKEMEGATTSEEEQEDPVVVTPDKKLSPPQPIIMLSSAPEVVELLPNEEDALLDNPSSEMQLSEHSKELFDQEDVLLQYEAHVSSTSIDPNDAITPVMSAAVVLQTLDEDTIVQDVKGDNFTEEQVTPLDTTKDLVDCSDDDQAVDVLQDSTSEHSEKEMEGATTSEEEQEDVSEDTKLDNSDHPGVCVERVESTNKKPQEESGNATHFSNSVNETHDKEAAEDTTEKPVASDLGGAELPHKPQDDSLNTTAEMTDSDESADSDDSVSLRDDTPLFVENNPAHEIATSSSSSVASSTSVDEEDGDKADPVPEVAEMQDESDISKETAPESENDVSEDGSLTLLLSMGGIVLAPEEKESTDNDETETIHMNKVEVDDLIAPDEMISTTDMDPAIVLEVQEQELPSEIEDTNNDKVENGDDKEPEEHVITTGERILENELELDSTDFENQETIVAMKDEAITVPEGTTINQESADAPIVLNATQLESKTQSDSICDNDKDSAYVKQDETFSVVQSELVLSLGGDEIVPEEKNVPIETEEYPNEQVEHDDPNGNTEPREEASDVKGGNDSLVMGALVATAVAKTVDEVNDTGSCDDVSLTQQVDPPVQVDTPQEEESLEEKETEICSSGDFSEENEVEEKEEDTNQISIIATPLGTTPPRHHEESTESFDNLIDQPAVEAGEVTDNASIVTENDMNKMSEPLVMQDEGMRQTVTGNGESSNIGPDTLSTDQACGDILDVEVTDVNQTFEAEVLVANTPLFEDKTIEHISATAKDEHQIGQQADEMVGVLGDEMQAIQVEPDTLDENLLANENVYTEKLVYTIESEALLVVDDTPSLKEEPAENIPKTQFDESKTGEPVKHASYTASQVVNTAETTEVETASETALVQATMEAENEDIIESNVSLVVDATRELEKDTVETIFMEEADENRTREPVGQVSTVTSEAESEAEETEVEDYGVDEIELVPKTPEDPEVLLVADAAPVVHEELMNIMPTNGPDQNQNFEPAEEACDVVIEKAEAKSKAATRGDHDINDNALDQEDLEATDEKVTQISVPEELVTMDTISVFPVEIVQTNSANDTKEDQNMESKEVEPVVVDKPDENVPSSNQNASPEELVVSLTPVVTTKKEKKPKKTKVEKPWWEKSLKWLNPLDNESSQSDDSSQEESVLADASLEGCYLSEIDSHADGQDPPSLETKEVVDDTIIPNGDSEVVAIAAAPMIEEQLVVELPHNELDVTESSEVAVEVSGKEEVDNTVEGTEVESTGENTLAQEIMESENEDIIESDVSLVVDATPSLEEETIETISMEKADENQTRDPSGQVSTIVSEAEGDAEETGIDVAMVLCIDSSSCENDGSDTQTRATSVEVDTDQNKLDEKSQDRVLAADSNLNHYKDGDDHQDVEHNDDNSWVFDGSDNSAELAEKDVTVVCIDSSSCENDGLDTHTRATAVDVDMDKITLHDKIQDIVLVADSDLNHDPEGDERQDVEQKEDESWVFDGSEKSTGQTETEIAVVCSDSSSQESFTVIYVDTKGTIDKQELSVENGFEMEGDENKTDVPGAHKSVVAADKSDFPEVEVDSVNKTVEAIEGYSIQNSEPDLLVAPAKPCTMENISLDEMESEFVMQTKEDDLPIVDEEEKEHTSVQPTEETPTEKCSIQEHVQEPEELSDSRLEQDTIIPVALVATSRIVSEAMFDESPVVQEESPTTRLEEIDSVEEAASVEVNTLLTAERLMNNTEYDSSNDSSEEEQGNCADASTAFEEMAGFKQGQMIDSVPEIGLDVDSSIPSAWEKTRMKWIQEALPVLALGPLYRSKRQSTPLHRHHESWVNHWKRKDYGVLNETRGVWLSLEGPSPRVNLSENPDMLLPWDDRWGMWMPKRAPPKDSVKVDISTNQSKEEKPTRPVRFNLPQPIKLIHVRAVNLWLQDFLLQGKVKESLQVLQAHLLPALLKERDASLMPWCHLAIASTMKNIASLQLYLGLNEEAISTLWDACNHAKLRTAIDESPDEVHCRNLDDALRGYTVIYLVYLGMALYALHEWEDSNTVFLKALIMLQKEAASAVAGVKDHGQMAMAKVLNNMGCAFVEKREYERAQLTFERSAVLYPTDFHVPIAQEEATLSTSSSRMSSSPPRTVRFNVGILQRLKTPVHVDVNSDPCPTFPQTAGCMEVLVTACNYGFSLVKAKNEAALIAFYKVILLHESSTEKDFQFVLLSLESLAFVNTRMEMYGSAIQVGI